MQVPVPHGVVRRLGHDPESFVTLAQRLFVPLPLEHRRRLVGAHAEEQTVFFAGKGRLLRARDQYPVLSVVPDGDDDDAQRPGPYGLPAGWPPPPPPPLHPHPDPPPALPPPSSWVTS